MKTQGVKEEEEEEEEEREIIEETSEVGGRSVQKFEAQIFLSSSLPPLFFLSLVCK